MICRKCDQPLDEAAEFCGNCGTAVNPSRHPAPAIPEIAHEAKPAGNPIFNGYATGALVMGIVAIPASLIPFFGIPVSVSALTLGILGRHSTRRQRAIIGITLAVLGLILTVVIFRLYLSHQVIKQTTGDPGLNQ